MQTHYDIENAFALLCMGVVGSLTLLLMVPWPPSVMAILLRFVKTVSKSDQARWTFFMVFGFVLVMFLWSYNAMNTVTNELQTMKENAAINAVTDMDTRLAMNLKKFRSQRNVYITGFSLFSSLILLRFYKLLSRIGELDEEIKKEKKN